MEHTSCVDDVDNFHWCALEVNEDREHLDSHRYFFSFVFNFLIYFAVRFGVCEGTCASENTMDTVAKEEDKTSVAEENCNLCKFPFNYQGVSYDSCTWADDEEGSWCPTKLKENGELFDSESWIHCQGNCQVESPVQHAFSTAYQQPDQQHSPAPHEEDDNCHLCNFPFNYKGRVYTSCTMVEDDQPWCATDVNEKGDILDAESWVHCKGNCGNQISAEEVKAESESAENVDKCGNKCNSPNNDCNKDTGLCVCKLGYAMDANFDCRCIEGNTFSFV